MLLFFISACSTTQHQWGRSNSPNQQWQVILEQKERSMHQAPEILVSYITKDENKPIYVGSILLPEDNRNEFTYNCHWDGAIFYLTISCDYCMISKRYYSIDFENRTPTLSRINPETNTRITLAD